MNENNQNALIEAMEDIRSLSFSICQKAKNLQVQQKRIDNIINGVRETIHLQTSYNIESKKISNKLEQIKQLSAKKFV